MDNILAFLNKWGVSVLILICMVTFFNTCGVKGDVERLDRKIKALEQTIIFNDSINREINSIEREILMYETSMEIVYTNNAIVRTTERPDDVMNKYSVKIKELQIKKEKLNATRKQTP